MDRRTFLAAVSAGLASLTLPGRRGRAAPAPEPPPDVLRALPPLVTPTEDFFEVSKNLPWLGGSPRVRGSAWRLRVDGLVARSLTLTLDDLRARPAETPLVTLQCISNEVGGPLIGTARWRGVRLALLLAEAGRAPGGRELVFHCADGYTETLPIAALASEPAWLVYGINDAPLPRGHGFPARVLLPARYGMKSPKWVERIEVAGEPRSGYWQRRGGWDEEAWLEPTSQVLRPAAGLLRTIPASGTWVAGVAFAGLRGVSGVEVTPDGRRTWHEAWLEPAASPWAWRRWAWRWTPRPGDAVAPGRHVLQVRALDGAGVPQPAADAPPYPAGARGLHGRLVHLESDRGPAGRQP